MREISAWGILPGDAGIGFDLDAPGGVEQGGDYDHGGGGADEREEFAVDPPGDFPVLGVGEIDACAVDVLDGAAGVFERGGDEGEALLCLLGDVCVVGADGGGTGDVDFVADADGSGEADDGLEGAGAGDVGAGHGLVRSGVGVASAAMVAYLMELSCFAEAGGWMTFVWGRCGYDREESKGAMRSY